MAQGDWQMGEILHWARPYDGFEDGFTADPGTFWQVLERTRKKEGSPFVKLQEVGSKLVADWKTKDGQVIGTHSQDPANGLFEAYVEPDPKKLTPTIIHVSGDDSRFAPVGSNIFYKRTNKPFRGQDILGSLWDELMPKNESKAKWIEDHDIIIAGTEPNGHESFTDKREREKLGGCRLSVVLSQSVTRRKLFAELAKKAIETSTIFTKSQKHTLILTLFY